MATDQKKEYIVIYKSLEHFEVLGFVKADSLKEARELAQKELIAEAKNYQVAEAEIAELKDLNQIFFNLS